MDTPNRCPECDCEEIIYDNFIPVCSDCGNVISENVAAVENSTLTNFSKDAAKRTTVNCNRVSFKNQHVDIFCRNYTSSVNPRLTRPVQHGIDVIYKVCKNLNLPSSISQMSINLFKEIVIEKPFKRESSRAKLCLAILCIYMVSNRENNPITLTELWNNTDCTFDHFGAMLMRLEKLYPQIYPNKSKYIESLLPFYLFKMRLDEKEKPIIADYAINLLWLWREALLVQAFNPVYVIYSALYFAWKATDLDRSNIGSLDFCLMVNIEFKPIIRERIHFFGKVLQDFYRCSPFYLNEEMSQNLIILKLKDMLKMKRIILWNYNNSELNLHNKRIEQDALKQASIQISQPLNITNDNQKDDDNFSDTEIDSYIRTDEEVRNIVNLAHKMA